MSRQYSRPRQVQHLLRDLAVARERECSLVLRAQISREIDKLVREVAEFKAKNWKTQ